MSHHPKSRLVRLGGRVLLACLAALAFSTSASAANVCRVTSTGAAGGSGTWAAPMDLQAALGNSACSEVWVKSGTYKPTTSTDRTVSFTLDRKVAVYGGFAGSELDRHQRNPVAHVSVLSGDIGTAGNVSDNSYHVVYIVGTAVTNIDHDTVLDGFTITGGNASGLSLPLFNGGGLLCEGQGAGGQCSPTLRQLIFTENRASAAGGAMKLSCWVDASANPVLSDLHFSNNHAGTGGGALHRSSTCDGAFALDRVTFERNDANKGGAMYVEFNAGVSLRDVTFTNNTANMDGGAMYNASVDSVILDRVNFDGNSAKEHGGAMYNSASAAGHTSVISITDVTFNNNSAVSGAGDGKGGALYNEAFGTNIELVLSKVTLSNNHANYAGAIHNSTSYLVGDLKATLGNVTFSNNSATGSGRDMSSSAQKGSLTLALRNVTLDSINNGYYSLINTASSTGTVSLDLSNVILWDPARSLPIVNSGAGATTHIDHSIIVRSNGSGSTWLDSLGTDGGGNLDVDPLLGALGSNGGFTETMLPAAGSVAINAGNASTCAMAPVAGRDQRGGSRPHGPQCDIGAVEVGAVSDVIFANGFD